MDVKILILDDDEVVRRLIANTLKGKKYTVLEAESARIAIDMLRQDQAEYQQSKDDSDPISIVVIDIMMPDTDGIKALVECKKEFPDLKFIVMSSSNHLLEKVKLFNPNAVLPKPINLSKLTQAVEDLISK